MNSKIYKLSEKLPKVNKPVFIFTDDFDGFTQAKLKIYDKKTCTLSFKNEKLKNGDIFWQSYDLEDERKVWYSVEECRIWTGKEDFLKILLNYNKNEDVVKNSRFDLLDIRNEENED